MSSLTTNFNFSTTPPSSGTGQGHTNETRLALNKLTPSLFNEYERVLYDATSIIGDYNFSSIPGTSSTLRSAIDAIYNETIDGREHTIDHPVTIDSTNDISPLILRSSDLSIYSSGSVILIGDDDTGQEISARAINASGLVTFLPFGESGIKMTVSTISGAYDNGCFSIDTYGTYDPAHAKGKFKFSTDKAYPSMAIDTLEIDGETSIITGSFDRETNGLRTHGFTGTERYNADITEYYPTSSDSTTRVSYAFLDGSGAVESPTSPEPEVLSISKDGYSRTNTLRVNTIGPIEESQNIRADIVTVEHNIEVSNPLQSQVIAGYTDYPVEKVWTLYPVSLSGETATYGKSIASCGDFLAVGDETDSRVYIYKKGERGWYFYQMADAGTRTSSTYYGGHISMTETYMAIGARADDTDGLNYGAVYMFEHVNGMWEYVQKITPNPDDAYEDMYFGYSTSMSEDTLVIGHYEVLTSCGAYIYRRDPASGLWEESHKIETDMWAATVGLNSSVVGNVMVIPDVGWTMGGLLTLVGRVFIYEKINNTWAKTQTINGTSNFQGLGMITSTDGTRIVITSYIDPTLSVGTHCVYEKGDNGSWECTETFPTLDTGAGGYQYISNSRIIAGNSSATDGYMFPEIYDYEDGEWYTTTLSGYVRYSGNYEVIPETYGNTIFIAEAENSEFVRCIEVEKPAPATAVYYDYWKEEWRKHTCDVSPLSSGIYFGDGKVAVDGLDMYVTISGNNDGSITHNGDIVSGRWSEPAVNRRQAFTNSGSGEIEIHFNETSGEIYLPVVFANLPTTVTDIDGSERLGHSVTSFGYGFVAGCPYTSGDLDQEGKIRIYEKSGEVWDCTEIECPDAISVVGAKLGYSTAAFADIVVAGAPWGTHPDASGEVPPGAVAVCRKGTPVQTEVYSLRDAGPAGGHIFKVSQDEDGTFTYYEMAPASENVTGLAWSSDETTLHRTSSTYCADSMSNSRVIVAGLNDLGESNRAAQVCCDNTYGGYTDWCLPTSGCLQDIYDELHTHGVGGLENVLAYWSSTEVSSSGVVCFSMNTGNSSIGDKSTTAWMQTRPVRSFQLPLQREWSHSTYLDPPLGMEGGEFGHSVATNGDIIVVGCPAESTTEDSSGSAEIYYRSGLDSWTHINTIKASSPTLSGQLGYSVDIDNNTIVIGEPGYNQNEGRVLIYRMEEIVFQTDGEEPTVTFVLEDTLTVVSPGSYSDTGFGSSVNVCGDMILVGGTDVSGTMTVYSFRRNNSEWLRTDLITSIGHNQSNQGEIIAMGGWDMFTSGGNGGVLHYKYDGRRWALARSYTFNIPGAQGYGTSVSVDQGLVLINFYTDIEAGVIPFTSTNEGANRLFRIAEAGL